MLEQFYCFRGGPLVILSVALLPGLDRGNLPVPVTRHGGTDLLLSGQQIRCCPEFTFLSLRLKQELGVYLTSAISDQCFV